MDALWTEWIDSISPFLNQIHVMYEHDLSSWVNFYTLFRPEGLHQFVEKTEDDYHRAKEGINAFAQLLSSDCVVRYGCVIILRLTITLC